MRERGKAREPDYIIVFIDTLLTVEQFEKMTVFFVVLGMLMFAGTLGK